MKKAFLLIVIACVVMVSAKPKVDTIKVVVPKTTITLKVDTIKTVTHDTMAIIRTFKDSSIITKQDTVKIEKPKKVEEPKKAEKPKKRGRKARKTSKKSDKKEDSK